MLRHIRFTGPLAVASIHAYIADAEVERETTVASYSAMANEQRDAAEERFRQRKPKRDRAVEAIKAGNLTAVNPPEQVARRVDRLTRYMRGEQVPVTVDEVPRAPAEEVMAASIDRAPRLADEARTTADPLGMAGAVLEKIINTADFVDVRYLQNGVAASRAVCRVQIRDEAGRVVGYGTGSLVSPRLVLTNHHVLPTAEAAKISAVEFDYEDGANGQPLQPRVFTLDPDSLFVADEERDFALVAVAASDATLNEFGFNRMIEATGKAVVGEFVTIVQHPRGEKKRVSLRENRIVDMLDTFLHYEADTEPGSSGSPVFNDQWEVVALHHASVPAPEHGELGGYKNEGVRISRILKFVRAQQLSESAKHLCAALLKPQTEARPNPPVIGRPRMPAIAPQPATGDGEDLAAEVAGGAVRITLPLNITVELGRRTSTDISPSAPFTEASRVEDGDERIVIDPNYKSRRGYQERFLGTDVAPVPLPSLPPELMAKAAKKSDATGGGRHVLTYHHFSVLLNKERGLAFATAVNIDGNQSRRLKREPDRWSSDPRISVEDQTGEAVYRDNELDRGHLVRRLDPAWGKSAAATKAANDDTFHFTNCSPQHKDFNQNKTSWAGLEDYVLENADNRDLKVCVFSGPVLADDDDEYRGVMLPRQFWKVVVMAKPDKSLSATGYLLSQASLIQGLERLEEFSYGAYRTYQAPVRLIESLTKLSFNGLSSADPLDSDGHEGLEAARLAAKEINSAEDLVL